LSTIKQKSKLTASVIFGLIATDFSIDCRGMQICTFIELNATTETHYILHITEWK